ncbi:Alpha/Beta hydrolase protein [Xylaria nigripes]|nr:Alpha/Beta hydrolase protein [Xylaria nigripes]
MEKIESCPSSGPQVGKGSLRSSLICSSTAPRPWRLRTREFLKSRAYISLFLLLVLDIYSGNFVREAQVGRRSRTQVQGDQPSLGDRELWTEWSDISPSEKLKWQPCFGIYGPNLQCARLTIPMDYSRPLNESADHPDVNLALVMITGAGRTQHPSTYAQAPLLVNPGGPGVSGVEFAQSMAKNLQLFVGSQHDIIGFDPRGVGASTPKADCFASLNSPDGVRGRNVAYMNRLTWLAGAQGIGLVNSSTGALTKLAARASAQAKLCQRVDGREGDNSIFRHMSTPNSARDMLSIIQAWDDWKFNGQATQPAKESGAAPLPSKGRTSDNSPQDPTGLRGKLVYWGFSYGTFLGETFALMFPDKVGRVVLDGVVQADHYVGPMWERSIADADAIWDIFFDYCAEEGPRCSLYRPGDSPQDIRRRFHETLSSLEEQPAIVLLPDTNIPTLVTADDVKATIFWYGLYEPITGFPLVAELLDHAFRGTLEQIALGSSLVSFCGNMSLPLWPDDAIKAVACSDKRYKLNDNITALQSRFESAASYSWFADVWFDSRPNLGCNGWGIESKEPPMRWDDHPAQEPAIIETGFPILFLSNTLDPVTPRDHALEMTRKFANASLVEQAAIGHCTTSCFSACTIQSLRAYLNDGIVPSTPNDGQWPKCECLERPWTPLANAADEPTGTASHMRAHQELRALFAASTISQQLDHNNPLKGFILERTGFKVASYL